MAMFLLNNKFESLVIILIKIVLLILSENELLTKGKTTVSANGNTVISGPFLQIEKPVTIRLLIHKPHLRHYLPCVATIEEDFYYQNETTYYYTWFRNGIAVHSAAERRSDFYMYRNGTLRLPTTERATGAYRCKINANKTAVLSDSISVEYPVLKRLPAATNISLGAGQSLTLDCPVLSVPPANVSWYCGNVSLSKIFKDNRYLFLANGSLVLRSLTPGDAGKIKCSAHNQYASKPQRQFLWSLTVLPAMHAGVVGSGAQLLPQLQNATQYLPQGGNLNLLCYAQQEDLAPPIEWWFQRNLSAPLQKLSNASNVWQIQYASIEQHDGHYICATPRDKQSFHVIVTLPPRILEPLPSYEAFIAASITFRCRAEGNPRPALSWYHNGMPLESSYTRYINGNELQIHSFDPNEDGIYQCFARNIAGEAYTAAEVRYRQRGEEPAQVNPLLNIHCYAHSFNTINVTFDSKVAQSLFTVYIVPSNRHSWYSPFAAAGLNNTSYAVISAVLPVYQPFTLIMRVLNPISEIRSVSKTHQQTIQSSLRSAPVTCCTQGLILHLVQLGSDTFVTWSQPELETTKYFILQFSVNFTRPHPRQLQTHGLRGTTRHVELLAQDVLPKLTDIEALSREATHELMQRVERQSANNLAEPIYNVVVTANVTGILLPQYMCVKLRVLIITEENENLAQDFRYVQWKTIGNDSCEALSTPFHLTTVESRMLGFHFQDGFNETCVVVCLLISHFPTINQGEPKCAKHTIFNEQLELPDLRPNERYHVNFLNCETHLLYGQLQVETLPDPPGTISNQRITRHNGLKLSWEPPLQPNGKVHHYNILWTVGNVTHEANVLECVGNCFYKFPNISESSKINVTVRVVGETGVGAPIFIDLRNINHHTLEVERSSSYSEVYSGIAIGSLLSICCVLCFVLVIVLHRRRFKARQQGPTHLTSPSDVNFGNLSNTGIPGDSAGGLSGSTLQQDCHEMQTLIPKARRQIEFLGDRAQPYQTTQLPNGNGKKVPHNGGDAESNTSAQLHFADSTANISQLPLCSSTPDRQRSSRARESVPLSDAKAFCIPFKQGPPNMVAATLHKQSSSAPNSLPLVVSPSLSTSCENGSSVMAHARRSGSLSSSSVGSNSSGSRKQFHTNFSKHSKSNDGICLLAEEESAATLTPTVEVQAQFMVVPTATVTTACPSNGYKTGTEFAKATKSQHNNNNNNQSKHPQIVTVALSGGSTATTTTIVPNIAATAGNAKQSTSVSPSPACQKPWPAPMKTKSGRATASEQAAATVSKLQRRPTLDPNG